MLRLANYYLQEHVLQLSMMGIQRYLAINRRTGLNWNCNLVVKDEKSEVHQSYYNSSWELNI